MILRYSLLFLSVSLLLISCRKKIIDQVAVISREDISIPGVSEPVNYFSFPSSSVGYAAAGNSVYKTSNGGITWSKLNLSGWSGACTGMEFFNDSIGMVLHSGYLKRTANGGKTWTIWGTCSGIGITSSGKGIIISDFDNWNYKYDILSSNDKGATFSVVGALNASSSSPVLTSRVIENKVYLLNTSFDPIYGFDLSSGNNFSLGCEEMINARSFFVSDLGGAIVGDRGLIADDIFSFSRSYYGTAYPFYGVDGMGGLMVAVGDKSIVTNMDIGRGENKRWSEVMDASSHGGFSNTFYNVRFSDEHTLYISGSNGLIWRAKI